MLLLLHRALGPPARARGRSARSEARHAHPPAECRAV